MSNYALPSSKSALSSLYWSRLRASLVSIEEMRFLRDIASLLSGIKWYYLTTDSSIFTISGISAACSETMGIIGIFSVFRLELRVNMLAFFVEERRRFLVCELL